MVDTALLDEFMDFIIQDNSKNLYEMDLEKDAPLSAVISFNAYKELIENAQKRGIEI